MQLRPEYWEQKAALAKQLANAKPVVKMIIAETGVSEKTAYRKLREVGFESGRKIRSDCGYIEPELKRHLVLLANLYHQHIKREAGTPLELVVELYIQSNPGVSLPSVSHIHALFRKLGLSRKHARQTTPKLDIKCTRPNSEHYFDTSVCRYYISPKKNILYMPVGDNYKNKPEKFRDKQVLVRHLIIDGASGAFFVWYSTTQKTIDYAQFLFHAWKNKGDDFIFHGVPDRLLMDNDSGLRSHAFLRMLNYLEVEVPNVMPYHPWVKGYVEKMMHLWEIWFESQFLFLKQKKAMGLDQINRLAYEYAIHFQKTRIHTRHNMTRFAAWSQGVQGHLRELPDFHSYMKLLHGDPVQRKISPQGILRYGGMKYKIKDTELYGNPVDCIEHPFFYRQNKSVTVIYPSSKVNPRNFLMPEKKKYTVEPFGVDIYGYRNEAHTWGDYKGLKHTASMNNFKEVDKAEPDVTPFQFEESNITFMPQTGEVIQPAGVLEPVEVEYTLIETKMHAASLLYRDLSWEDVRYIESLGKETFTRAEIDEIVRVLRVQSALSVMEG